MILCACEGVPILLAESCAVRIAIVCIGELLRELTSRTIIVTTEVLVDGGSIGVGRTSLNGSNIGSDSNIVRASEARIISVQDPISRNGVVGNIRLFRICGNIDRSVSAGVDSDDLTFVKITGRILSPQFWSDWWFGFCDCEWRATRVTDSNATSGHTSCLNISKVHGRGRTPSSLRSLDAQSCNWLGGGTGRHQGVLLSTIRPNGENVGVRTNSVGIENDGYCYGLAGLEDSIDRGYIF